MPKCTIGVTTMVRKGNGCHLKPATTTNMQAASIMVTASSAPSNTNSSAHTLQCQVNVTAFDTNNSDLEDDK